MTFLYKLTPGSCPKSYGVNVARLAGLPESVLKCAAKTAAAHEANAGEISFLIRHHPFFNLAKKLPQVRFSDSPV